MIYVLFYKRGKAMTEENNYKTMLFKTIDEALEAAEYFFHEYGNGARVVYESGEIYAEYEG